MIMRDMVFIDSFVAGLMAKHPQPGTNDTHGWIWECHRMEWWTACIVQMELTFLQCGKFYHWHWHPISELYYLRNQMPATSLLHCTISIQLISWNLTVEKDECITESKGNTIALLVTLLFSWHSPSRTIEYLKARVQTQPVWPSRGVTQRPDPKSHIRIAPSSSPEAM
jgi:hypothetical protein